MNYKWRYETWDFCFATPDDKIKDYDYLTKSLNNIFQDRIWGSGSGENATGSATLSKIIKKVI